MYKLYYSPGACSLAIHAILNELNQKFELVSAVGDAGQKRSPEFMKINPRGSVPVLIEDGNIIREGGAIIVYLLDKHDNDLLPKSGQKRAEALEWLMFANSTLHPAYSRLFWTVARIEDQKTKEHLLNLFFADIQKLWDEIEQRLQDRDYICGEKISAADFLLTVIANWSANFGDNIKLGNNCKKLFKQISKRDSMQKALADENVKYKVAA